MPLVGILARERARAFEKDSVTTRKNFMTTYREGAPPAPDRVELSHRNRGQVFAFVPLGGSACCFSVLFQRVVRGGVAFVPLVSLFVFVLPWLCSAKMKRKKISRCPKRNGFCLCGF